MAGESIANPVFFREKVGDFSWDDLECLPQFTATQELPGCSSMFGGTSRLMVANMIDRIGGIILIWRFPKIGVPPNHSI
jgi:hypothetical protein